MASNQLDIVNLAIIELGDALVVSLAADADAIDVANALYQPVKDDLLSKAPWRFAAKKIALSLVTSPAPLNEWSAQFDVPSDYVRIIRVYPDQAYEMFGRRIYANATSLACDYVHSCDEALMPPYFVTLIAVDLAERMSRAITGADQDKERLRDRRRFAFAEALSADAQQRPNVIPRSSPFVNVRFTTQRSG